MPSPLQETFDIDRISPKEVAETLRSLPNKSSCGSDEISYRLMKEAGPALVGPLVTLFNRSLLLRQVPDEWKKAIVIPIFKGGRKDRQEPSSYRPISLTSCVAQTMEKIVNAKILHFFKTNTFLYPLQSGFLPTHSTVTQLAYLVHKWQMALDRGESIESVFLVRLSKAYGRVSHRGLISKLSTCPYKNSHEFLNSNENLMRFSWHSHEIFPILMRISHEVILLMRISFFSWKLKAHKNLVIFSWENWHSHEIFPWAFLLVRISFFSRALKAHESLMRFSWDSHEKTLSRKLCFCFFSWLYRVIPSIRNFLLRMWFHVFSRSHAKVNFRCMYVVLVKENHFEVLSSSKLNMFTWVETRLCILVHVRVLVTWQRTNSGA